MPNVLGVHCCDSGTAYDGPEEMIGEIYDLYAGELLGHCTKILGDYVEAEDALQQTIINAFGAIHTLRKAEARGVWLYRIATNVCISMLRRKGRKGMVCMESIKDHIDQRSSQTQVLAARQTVSRLFDLLDENDLTIVADYYLAGLDQGQIAKSLGVSRRAVVKRLTKIRKKLDRIDRASSRDADTKVRNCQELCLNA